VDLGTVDHKEKVWDDEDESRKKRRRPRDEQEAFIRSIEDSSRFPMGSMCSIVFLPQFVPMAKKRRVAAAVDTQTEQRLW
jgi:hypothetical protein